jgi:hypothetical protein
VFRSNNQPDQDDVLGGSLPLRRIWQCRHSGPDFIEGKAAFFCPPGNIFDVALIASHELRRHQQSWLGHGERKGAIATQHIDLEVVRKIDGE